jgi:predicted ATPase
MRLASIQYTEFPDTDNEWTLESLSLGKVNLLVGRNSTGKSRIINLISHLAKLLAGKTKEAIFTGHLTSTFTEENDQVSSLYQYDMTHDNYIVTHEQLTKNGQILFDRGEGGIGRIHAVEVGREIRFKISGRELAAVVKQDSIQHPFLQPLNDWGNAVRHFEFGKTLGHSNLAILVKTEVDLTDESNTNNVIPIFQKAKKAHGDEYVNAVIQDMEKLGYPLEELSIRKPTHIVILQAPGLFGLSVKERALKNWTDQPVISQGMFRTLSMVIQLNYYVFSKSDGTFLIDDIGEGLDYERSCILINLLREKASQSSIQLIMSTNDRFVMNSVPLEEWCVLQRSANRVRVFNYANSSSIFERFKRTGLSNFDLLTSDFVEKVTQHGENGDIRRGPDGEDLRGETHPGDGGETTHPH